MLNSITKVSFAFAEMLAAAQAAKALSEIKDRAEVAHGLYMVDGSGEGLEQTVIGSRTSSCLG
jgi:hypothetical protein